MVCLEKLFCCSYLPWVTKAPGLSPGQPVTESFLPLLLLKEESDFLLGKRMEGGCDNDLSFKNQREVCQSSVSNLVFPGLLFACVCVCVFLVLFVVEFMYEPRC